MSSKKDRFEQLISQSQIKENLGLKTYNQINNILIPCNEIIPFYQDSLFYMHFYNTLFLELWLIDRQNNNNIQMLNDIISTLHIKFDNSVQVESSRMGILSTINTDNKNSYVFTFYTDNFNKYYHNINSYNYYSSSILLSGQRTYPFIIKSPTGTNAYASIIIDTANGNIITTDNKKITITEGGSKFNDNKAETVTLFNSIINLVDLNDNSGIFSKLFTGIKDFEYTITNGVITNIIPLTAIATPSAIASSITLKTTDILTKYKPKIRDIVLLPNPIDSTKPYNIETIIDTNIVINSSGYYNKNTNFAINVNNLQNTYNEISTRQERFKKIILEILSQPVQNIFGYLLYLKIYYNCIVCNTSIQLLVRNLYLNKTTLNLTDSSTTTQLVEGLAESIHDHIKKLTINMQDLSDVTESASTDYITDKNLYFNRIQLLNETRDKYNNTLDNLNNVLSNYNQYIKYYEKLKKYSNSIIIFLIIVIVVTVLITILPMFNYNAKNIYYIIILIILISLTIIFYINFKHVSLYEKFYTDNTQTSQIQISEFNCSNTGNGFKNIDLNADSETQGPLRINNARHGEFSNKLVGSSNGVYYLSKYTATFLDLNNKLNSVLYITNSKSFSQDANTYLGKIYIEKKRRIDINKLKKTNFASVIEAIKKQINYLFNIILLISLITIIMLISLIWYNLAQFSINYILIFILISVSIVMLYFNSAIIQPTRHISSKYYWANVNPSKESLNGL